MGIFDKKRFSGAEKKPSTLVLKDEGKTVAAEKPAEAVRTAAVVRPTVKKYQVAEHAILKKPLVTEKNFKMALAHPTYVFEVLLSANKLDIRKAFFNITGVMPKRVNIVRGGGEHTRFGRMKGTAKLWKKAIITLKKGEKVDHF